MRRTRSGQNRHLMHRWERRPASVLAGCGPDDETPEGNRAAIANSVSYDDLAPELKARLERMRMSAPHSDREATA